MPDISLSKAVIPATRVIMTAKSERSVPGNIAYALFVLFCFWVATQMLNLIVQAPGLLEYLAQGNDASRPRIEMGLAVSTVFGLIPFLLGAVAIGIVALALRLRNRRHSTWFY
ncbi:membrane protein [Klebsiella michiganensis]|uniref:DUF2755 family protein n=1 Tax=Cedecea neteri TaxID=158822 RepID=UPI0005D8727C|nr:membrane protein [Klebsiella michiganensis]